MHIRRLTHLVVLAQQRNFARAAELLHLSQPALTRSVQAAEAEFGLRLFDRGGSGVTPTPAGEFVLERARRLVFDDRCLARDVALYRERALGDTAFGVGPFPVMTLLSSLLVELRLAHPAVGLRVELGNWAQLGQRLRDEDIEFFVADTRDLPPDPAWSVRALKREAGGFYVRAGHPLARRRTVALREMWDFGIASVRLPTAVRRVLAAGLDLAPGAVPAMAIECDDVGTLKQVCLATDTVLGAPRAAVAEDVTQGTLVPLRVTGLPALYAQMGVVTLLGRTLSPMAELIVRRIRSFEPPS